LRTARCCAPISCSAPESSTRRSRCIAPCAGVSIRSADQVDRFIATTADPASYYDRLTADPDIQTDDKLPPLALAWAREQAEDENVFVVIDDVVRSRDLVKQSRGSPHA
jgi:hypothetical protein